MKVSDFSFDLPEGLIARYPAADRTSSRLMTVDGNSGTIEHKQFVDILDFINPGDLLVFNDTRVIPARMFGQKASGGKLEVLVERVIDQHNVLAHIRSSKSPKPGSKILLENTVEAEVTGRRDALFEVRFGDDANVFDILERIGHMPLPPYIDRPDEDSDKERYQTVYNKNPGAVAAPTAGLHFDEAILEAIKQKGANTAFVTLHVGAGTFQPVRVDKVDEHVMHSEYIDVSDEVIEQIKATKAAGGKVIAVGTTSVRSLESTACIHARNGTDLAGYQGETDIFIYPGYRFHLVDAMLTNFHLPESTLIMLVSAFAGQQNIAEAYQQAIAQEYRFFSYGDAMFLSKQQDN